MFTLDENGFAVHYVSEVNGEVHPEVARRMCEWYNGMNREMATRTIKRQQMIGGYRDQSEIIKVSEGR